MSLSDHLDKIQQVLDTATQQHNWPLKNVFCSGLRAIQASSSDYDQIVDDQNPFYKEFTLCSQQDVISADELFSLFECMVIFIRMRQIAKPNIALSNTEKNVLHFFETCGEWTACDDTMVCQWYWKRLPGKCSKH